MNDEKRKILDMLAEGKITADEAERLLTALGEIERMDSQEEVPLKKIRFKYLRVMVEPGPENAKGDKVNIRVPVKLLRAGIKLASLLPHDVREKVDDSLKEKGIPWNLAQITDKNLEEIIEGLNNLTVDVEGKDTVRIFCE